jgi:glycosyltransferase involved in cell wall biosynthesis
VTNVNKEFLVSHFCCALDRYKGGVTTGILLTVEQLSHYGIQSQIFSAGMTKNQIKTNKNELRNLTQIGVDFKYSKSRIQNEYGLGSLRGIRRVLSKFSKPNIIILHQVYTLSTLLGYRYARLSGIPYAVMPHGSLTKYHESDSKVIKKIAKKFFISKILRNADSIIVTCKNEKDDLDVMLQLKAHIIKYGSNLNKNSVSLNLKMNRVGDGTRIMFSGRFDKKKNLPLLLNTIPEILNFYPEIILDIAGSGNKKEMRNLKKIITKLKLEENVEFHGWIDKNKLSKMFSDTRLLVLPSENENFALIVSEALSSGVPCVVSKFVGTSDIVAKHQAGEIIEELTPASIAASIIKVLEGDSYFYRNAAIHAATMDLDWSNIALEWKTLIRSMTVR